jgi:predicted ATPase
MADKLIVKNFGPITNAELDIKKTTVFIGPQGSGKSTLAKLVAIFRDNITVDLEHIENSDRLNNRFKHFNLKNYFKPNTVLNFATEKYEIDYADSVYSKKKDSDFIDKVKTHTLNSLKNNPETLKILEEEVAKINPKILENIQINSQEDIRSSFHEIVGILENIDDKQMDVVFTKLLSPFIENETTKEFLHISKTPIYVPAERAFFSTISEVLFGLISNDIALPKFLTSFGSEFEKARKEFTSFKISFLDGIEYKYENGQNLVSTRDGNFILLSESASGIQSVVPLAVIIIYFNHLTEDLPNEEQVLSALSKTFIIEEPELNLYPTTQKGLIYSLAKSCTKGNNELLMTTHSPYILAALNNLIFAYKTAQKHPNKADEVAKIVPRESWLNPDEFAAYFVDKVDKNEVRSIINPKTGMISENELDGVSEDFKIEFDELVEIYRLPVHEAVY